MSQPKREAFVILFFTSNGASLNGRQSTFIHPCLVGFDPHTIDFQGLLPLCQGRNGHVTSCSRRGKCESYCKATQRYPAVELCIFGDVGSCSAMLLLRWYTQIYSQVVSGSCWSMLLYMSLRTGWFDAKLLFSGWIPGMWSFFSECPSFISQVSVHCQQKRSFEWSFQVETTSSHRRGMSPVLAIYILVLLCQ